MAEIADHGDADILAALDRDHGAMALGLAGAQIDLAVDAGIGALLAALPGLGVGDERDGPELEGVRVLIEQSLSAVVVLRQADDLELRGSAEGLGEAALDQVDGERSDIDADPLAAEFLGGVDGGAAAAERIEDDVAGIGRGGDDALEQGDGFLGGVAQALGGLGSDWRNVCPERLKRNSRHLVEVALLAWYGAWL